jgi:hypothetical protein
MPAAVELPLSAQTAYAQLFEAALAADHARSVADLRGSFAKKTVKGAAYWYYQYTEPSGALRQIYVGPESDAVERLRARKRAPTASARLGPLARAAAALGCAEILPRHARVLGRLAEYGFFRAGGVLVGTHAFLACGNMLGVKWGDAERTEDVDLAHAGRSVSLALPGDAALDADRAIRSLEMGFLPLQGLDGGGASYLIPKEPEFRLDFLAPRHREGDRPYLHPRLGVRLQPLRFIEYLLEDVQQAALFAGDTVVLVNVPSPARYALHKLLVWGERRGAFAAKSAKDLRQAGALLERLKETRRSDVGRAWRDLASRGPVWRSRLRPALKALDRQFPALEAPRWLALPARRRAR